MSSRSDARAAGAENVADITPSITPRHRQRPGTRSPVPPATGAHVRDAAAPGRAWRPASSRASTAIHLHRDVLGWLLDLDLDLVVVSPPLRATAERIAADLTEARADAPRAVVVPLPALRVALASPRGQEVLRPPVTHVIDLSGVYLPDQGAPLAVLFTATPIARDGRAKPPTTVRALRCLRGDPDYLRVHPGCAVWRVVTGGAWDILGVGTYTETSDQDATDAAALASWLGGAP